jgi:hypothetical protein
VARHDGAPRARRRGRLARRARDRLVRAARPAAAPETLGEMLAGHLGDRDAEMAVVEEHWPGY